MQVPHFGLFVAASVVLFVTPGPAVLYIVARSLEQGRTAGLVSTCGLHTGTLVHVAAAVAGISALLSSSTLALSLVRWAGAAFLVYLGVRELTGGTADLPVVPAQAGAPADLPVVTAQAEAPVPGAPAPSTIAPPAPVAPRAPEAAAALHAPQATATPQAPRATAALHEPPATTAPQASRATAALHEPPATAAPLASQRIAGLQAPEPRDAPPTPAAGPSFRRLFTQGILINVLNPKVALFLLAFMPQFVDAARGAVWRQMAFLGLSFVALGLAIDFLYALVAGSAGGWLRGSRRFLRGTRYVTGSLYLGLGLAAAFSPTGRPPGAAAPGAVAPAVTGR